MFRIPGSSTKAHQFFREGTRAIVCYITSSSADLFFFLNFAHYFRINQIFICKMSLKLKVRPSCGSRHLVVSRLDTIYISIAGSPPVGLKESMQKMVAAIFLQKTRSCLLISLNGHLRTEVRALAVLPFFSRDTYLPVAIKMEIPVNSQWLCFSHVSLEEERSSVSRVDIS